MPTTLAVVALYLSFADLGQRGIPYTRTHLRRLMAAGKFPLARQLSPKRIAWLASEVDAWIASRPPVKPMKKPEPSPASAPRPRLTKT